MKWRVLINQIFPSHPVISANSRCDAKWHTSFTKLRASPSIDSVLDRDVGHTFWHKNESVYRHTACIYLFWKIYIYIYYITCICIEIWLYINTSLKHKCWRINLGSFRSDDLWIHQQDFLKSDPMKHLSFSSRFGRKKQLLLNRPRKLAKTRKSRWSVEPN